MNETDLHRSDRRAFNRATLAILIFFSPLFISAAAAQSLPPGWAVSDVGGPTVPGFATYSNQTFTVSGAGSGIGGAADEFTLAYRQLTGDGTIVARVGALPLTAVAAQAGVMIRQGLSAGAPHASVVVSRTDGITFRRRRSSGGATSSTAAAGGTSAVWVRVDRRSSTVTASYSTTGSTWTLLGTDTVAMNNVLYVGLAVSSRLDVAAVQGTFTGVQVTSLVEYGGALPAGWASQDLGAPGQAGAAAYDTGTFGLVGGGSDIGGTWDAFRFAYGQVTADVDIVARVRDLGNTNAQSKAGVMIRDSLTPNGSHASMFVTASGSTVFRRRPSAGQATVDTAGPSNQAPVWLKLSLRDGVVSGYQSLDGVTWALVGTQALTLPSPYYVGLAVTSRDNAATVTTNIDNVLVTAAGNTAPTVALSEPADGATYVAPATIVITADASDTDGTIARVDFYQGATLIGSATSSPYSVTWTDVPAGTYSLTARAVDDDGATTTSAARTVAVNMNPPPNQPPAVALTAPADGATFTAPATMTVSANASDNDGTIARVDFFQGTTLIGSATASPYSVTWNNVPAGTYSLTARATDDDGATTTSAARTVTVNPPANQPPAAALTAPANGATFTAPASITINATASDTDGTVTRVDFFQGTTLIGSDTTSPYSFTWSNVPAGTYSLTARATDDDGATTTSAARTVTVNPAANQPPTAALTAPANGATFTAPASITINATAGDTDGTVARVDFFQGTTLIGSDTTSPYSVTWNNVPAGTYSLTARATDDDGATTTSAARTVTVNPPANQAPTVALTAPANGATFAAPASITIDATASDGDGTVTRVDFFQGTTLIGSDTTSPYSFTWNNVPAGTYSLTARATDNAGAATSSAARSVTVTAALPAGWTAADIGNPTPAGGTSYSGSTFTMTAGGTDVWGTADQFQFAYQTATGDVDVIARLATLGQADPWSKAGVMVRATLAADAAHASIFSSAANGMAFQRRPTTGGASVHTAGSADVAPVWMKLERRGTTITAFESADGTTWTAVGTETLTLPATFYVGLAATSHNGASTIDATFDSVVVQAPASNQAPAASLTAPANGATFTAPASITINATASDADGTVTRVDFFQGTTLIGSDTTSPYSFTWSNVPAGTYSLTARATDDDGATTTSAARTVTVNPAASNQPPSAALTAPANGATFTAPASITITATASDTDGTVARVDFFQGTTLIGSDTTSPYSFTWNNVPAGTYSLTARATDDDGATTTSAARTVTVNAAVQQRNAVFNASPDHNTLVNSYVLEIFAAGANPSTATPIATQNLGKPAVVNGECTADVTTTINGLAPGNYQATVSAVGSSGSSRSAPASFTR